MGVTLEDVLGFDIMRQARLVSTSHDLNIPVKGITVMEAPDVAGWVDGGELILTNLFSVYDNADAMVKLVRDLSQKGVAALIVKTRRFVDQIPPLLLEEAERLRLAVVEIPPHLRYMDIMYSVMAAVFKNQVVHLSYFKQTYHQLTTLALKNCGIAEIAKTLGGMVDNPILLYDSAGQLLFQSADGLPGAEEGTAVTHQYDDLRYYSRDITLDGSIYKKLIFPIKLFNFTRANLCVIEKNRRLSELDFIALQTAVTVLRLNLLSEHTRANTELKYRQEIIEDILSGTGGGLQDRAPMIGWRQNRQYALIVAEYDGKDKTLEDDTVEAQLVIDSFSDRIRARVESYLKIRGHQAIVGIKRRRVIIFAQGEEDAAAGQAEAAQRGRLAELCSQIMQAVAADAPQLAFYFGYTSAWGGLNDMPKLYRQAQDAIAVGKILHSGSFCCDYSGLGVYRLLCSVADRDRLAEFVPEGLWALHRHESKKPSGQLLKTLERLLENGGNASQTAKDLFIHYKTLNYRMQKIQQITGIDWKNTEELLELQIGIKIMHILEPAP